MDQSSSVNKWHLVVLSTFIIGLILCLSWTPAYGFGFSKADLAAGSSGTPGGNPPVAGTPGVNGSDSSMPTTFGTASFADSPATCPPPVPEPATLILIGLGLAGGAAVKRLRG